MLGQLLIYSSIEATNIKGCPKIMLLEHPRVLKIINFKLHCTNVNNESILHIGS